MSPNFYSGRSPSQEKLDKLIKDHDKDGNGTIGWFTWDWSKKRYFEKVYAIIFGNLRWSIKIKFDDLLKISWN